MKTHGRFHRVVIFTFAAVALLGVCRNAFAEDEESLLPADYYRLSYIESTGTQYIKTGVRPNGATVKVDIKYQFTEVVNDTYAFGIWDGETSSGTAVGQFQNTLSDGTKKTQIRYRVYKNAGFYGEADTDVHEVSLNAADGTTIDGTYLDSQMANIPDHGTLEFYAFGRNNSGHYDHPTKVRIYRLAIALGGKPERDFVPCERLTDGALGLYDLVYGRFYPNDGTNEFGKPSVQGPISEAEFKREYLRVKYVQDELLPNSDTPPYVKTGIKPDGRIPQVDMTYRLVSSNITQSSYVFGYWDGTYGTAIGYEPNIGGRYRVYGTAEYYGTPDTGVHTVSLNGTDGTKVDGKAVMPSIKDVKDDSEYEYLIFARSGSDGRILNPSVAQVFALTIRLDGKLVRDFVPCVRRADGKPCLFDRVERCVYFNCGGGRLSAGYPASAIQRLEFAEATGAQYVDTGVTPNGRVPVVRMHYQMMNTVNDKYAFGYWDGGTQTGTAIGHFNGQMRYRVYDKGDYYGTADTNAHTIVLNCGEGTCVDGEKRSNDPHGVADLQSSVNYVLFGRMQATGSRQVEFSCSRIYSFALNLDGETVLDLLPAKPRGGSVVGLWDRRTGRFFAPTTGALVGGPEINKGLYFMLK